MEGGRRYERGTGKARGGNGPAAARLGEQTRGLAGEYAHEQGWGLNTEERSHQTNEKQPYDGGKSYEYGARDFGDTPTDTSKVEPSPEAQAALDQNVEKGH